MSDDKYLLAFKSTVWLGTGISIDGYMLPSGEMRYGLEHISVLLGYKENYFRRQLQDLHRTKKATKKLKALLEKGFTAYVKRVKVPRETGRGAATPHTISFADFCLVIEHEASIQNSKALALLSASFRELLRSRTQEAFGIPQDSFEKRQLDFQESYESYLQREKIFQEAREDVAALSLPGDEDGYDLIEESELEINSINAYWASLYGEMLIEVSC